MNPSIPANQLVNVIPSVLGAGGNPLSPNSVFLTEDPSIPIGTVQGFGSLAAVQSWFGANAPESVLAAIYFAGFLGTRSLPSVLYFAQYNVAAVAGYLRGGSTAGMTLTQLQALTGTLTVVIDAVSHVSAAINLSGATSFSNAAALIQTGLDGGTPSSTATVTYDSLRQAFLITSSTTGASSAVAYPTTGTLATGLLLTAATGATLSHGAVAAVPATLMNTIVAVNQNWVTFLLVTDPDAGGEPATVKLQFAAWVSTQSPAGNERFCFLGWDADLTPSTSNPAAGSFGAAVAAAGYNGVCVIWDQTAGQKAAGIAGITACLDTTQTNGRITYAYKNVPGLVADVTSETAANNLLANGYNFYGSYATANDQFTFFQPGSVSGTWDWLDEYIDQILMNSAFQLALLELLTNINSIPYNNRGYALLRSALQDPIDQFLNFGAIQAGVPLSSAQAAEVNTAAGVKIDNILETQGYYLQIIPATAQVRGGRTSPPMTFWYTDGGSIQKIQLASIDVQ